MYPKLFFQTVQIVIHQMAQSQFLSVPGHLLVLAQLLSKLIGG